MMPSTATEANMNMWEWINFYGSGLGAIAGIAAAVVAILALLSAAFDTGIQSKVLGIRI